VTRFSSPSPRVESRQRKILNCRPWILRTSRWNMTPSGTAVLQDTVARFGPANLGWSMQVGRSNETGTQLVVINTLKQRRGSAGICMPFLQRFHLRSIIRNVNQFCKRGDRIILETASQVIVRRSSKFWHHKMMVVKPLRKMKYNLVNLSMVIAASVSQGYLVKLIPAFRIREARI
jgi:hypothetical protein